MKKVTNLLLISILIITSCGVPKHIRNDFAVPYNGNDIVHDSVFNTKGCYIVPVIEPNDTDTGYLHYIFFTDGLFVTISTPDPNYSVKVLNEIASDSTGWFKRSFYVGYSWGKYKIKGNVIIAQSINHPCPPKVWSASEKRFLILDTNKIVLLSSKVLGRYPKYDMERWEKRKKSIKYLPSVFVQVPYIPESNSWILKYKWFWTDENKYKAYMKKLKAEKRSKKNINN